MSSVDGVGMVATSYAATTAIMHSAKAASRGTSAEMNSPTSWKQVRMYFYKYCNICKKYYVPDII